MIRLALALAGLLACGGSATVTPAVERVQEVAAPTSSAEPTEMVLPTVLPTSSSVPTEAADSGQPDMWDCPTYESIGDALYMASRERDKFHVVICQWAEEIADENRICFRTREAAIEAGFEPCSICQP